MSLFFVLTRAALGLPDIIELIRLNIPIIFTCANDYADVKVSHAVLKYYTCFLESLRGTLTLDSQGETIIMHVNTRHRTPEDSPSRLLISITLSLDSPKLLRMQKALNPPLFPFFLRNFLECPKSQSCTRT